MGGGTHLAADTFAFDHGTMVENILKVYVMSNYDDAESGVLWYVRANEWAASVASAFGLTVDTVAQVIAALSPLTNWETNLELAAMAIRQWADGDAPNLPTLSNSWKRARAILDGADPTWQPKTAAFWHLIAEPLSSAWICIDSHAYAIALGIDRPGTFTATAKSYALVADAYREAAERVGLLPTHLQAITWVTRRRLLTESGAKGSQSRKG